MPLNTLRLNQKHLHPNERITFIKSIPERPTTQKAELFLQKIAAICYPIMKAHHLSITTLEEFPPNREFMGRNFNGGEVIQLVLRRMPRRGTSAAQRYGAIASTGTIRSGSSAASIPSGIAVHGNGGRLDPHSSDFVAEDGDGGWLDFRAVSMVMMHELAHCIEMNHSKAFWKVRNEYAEHLRLLWARGYTGEGVWGRGQALQDGTFDRAGCGGTGDFADLCGGAYRGRRGRRGRAAQKEAVSYAERKKRKLDKIESKFGKGAAVGENESLKVMLEGKMIGSKPRVANSKRGRDLRANAALARFGKAKSELDEALTTDRDGEEPTGSDSGSDTATHPAYDRLVDVHGKPVKDGKGNDLYRVCDQGPKQNDHDARCELDELNALSITGHLDDEAKEVIHDEADKAVDTEVDVPLRAYIPPDDNLDDGTVTDDLKDPPRSTATAYDLASTHGSLAMAGEAPKPTRPLSSARTTFRPNGTTRPTSTAQASTPDAGSSRSGITHSAALRTCAVCSLANGLMSGTCQVCGNVLDRSRIPGSWACGTRSCGKIGYVNAGDVGVCGICGSRKRWTS